MSHPVAPGSSYVKIKTTIYNPVNRVYTSSIRARRLTYLSRTLLAISGQENLLVWFLSSYFHAVSYFRNCKKVSQFIPLCRHYSMCVHMHVVQASRAFCSLNMCTVITSILKEDRREKVLVQVQNQLVPGLFVPIQILASTLRRISSEWENRRNRWYLHVFRSSLWAIAGFHMQNSYR